ncbi:auxin-responsive protein SAUR50-like [Curcuma longa]|uniref:auxin-responsive protein SAUR50-like n=1 Tax=Curcuma longa TaxID=136217 RepID=UPI003D9E2349
MGKCSKLRYILRLRQMLLRRWRHAAEAAPDVPAGHVAVVCVGATSRRRFVVRASHLNHPAFRQLLRRAEEEEYGSPSSGGRPGPLALPCDEALFQRLILLISSSTSSSSSRPQNYCSLEGFEAVLSSSPGGSSFAGDSLPLLRDGSSIARYN